MTVMKKGRSLSGRRWQYGACVLLVQLAIGCSRSEPAPDKALSNTMDVSAPAQADQISTEAKLIVAFGDSLYAGFQLGAAEGFAPTLERELRSAHIDARVVNAGVSGDTSAAGLARLAFTLDGLPRKPDLMLVGLGGNDMLRGLSPTETRRNLDAILAELKRRAIPVLLTGMVASPNMGKDYAREFNGIYADLAREYSVGLYPFFLDGVIGQRTLILQDGIHPNAAGVKVIVEHVSAKVMQAVQSSPRPRT
jgi:acyl-CoA thioesterase-1